MAEGRSGRDLNSTPTWAVACVSAVIVLISILLELALHKIGKTFERRRKKALGDALEKIKGELMVLGFISLLLTFGQNYIAKICIPEHLANTMLPCPLPEHLSEGAGDHAPPVSGGGDHAPPVAGGGDHAPPVAGGGDHGPPVAGGGDHAPPDGGGGGTPAAEGGHAPPDKGGGGGEHASPTVEVGKGGVEHASPGGAEHTPAAAAGGAEGHKRRLLWYEQPRRVLSGDVATACPEGKVPVISINGLHQLHIFIFFLAVCHVIFGAITMNLGRLKIRGWKVWEREGAQEEEMATEASRFRLTHQTTFVRGNTSFLATTPFLFYPICFYRQFFRSVRKADYLTMRHGFIAVHLAPGSKFDFQRYIKRSLEDDFKVVVGISPLLWASAVLFLLLNVDGWKVMYWLSLMPLVTILAVGTKLQAIITQMAVEIQEKHAVVQGIPLVQVSDKHFWLAKPHFILHLIHFTLFQNAFEITYFIWITYEYGLHSCFHEDFEISLVRLLIGIMVQVVCSYITLPLYALVTQMGSNIKKSVFDDETNKALSKWTLQAKKKRPPTKPGATQATRTLGDPVEESPELSPGPESRLEMSNVDTSAANITASVDIHEDHHSGDGKKNNGQFPDLLTGP